MLKRVPYIASLATAAALTGCGVGSGVPDSTVMEPVGDGLRFIGISAVVAVLAVVLARSLEGGGGND